LKEPKALKHRQVLSKLSKKVQFQKAENSVTSKLLKNQKVDQPISKQHFD